MKKLILFAAVVAAFGFSVPIFAHHGESGRYDESLVTLNGSVVELQMINPHSIIVLDVPDANGKTTRWQAEMGGAQALIRGGWQNDVKAGTKVTLEGRRLKSGAPYMNMTERARITLSDSGKEVLRNANYGQPAEGGGTSNTGAAAAPAAR